MWANLSAGVMVQKQEIDSLISEVEGNEDVLFGSMNIGIKGA